jgi:hypothetical protein
LLVSFMLRRRTLSVLHLLGLLLLGFFSAGVGEGVEAARIESRLRWS